MAMQQQQQQVQGQGIARGRHCRSPRRRRRIISSMYLLLLYSLAALSWFMVSISFMEGDSHLQNSNDHSASMNSPYDDNNNDNDLNLLPPSVGLKFDWNAINNKNNLRHDNDDDDMDDDEENDLRTKHLRQTTTMGANNNNDTSAPTSVLNTTTNNNSLSNSTNLVVLSVCIPGERFSSEYIHASFYNKQSFCNKWGVECILSNHRLASDAASSTTIITTDQKSNTKQKKLLVYSPKWEKLYLLNRTLHTHPHADWLMWLDCDAAFTNLDIDWRTHMHPYLQDKTSKVLIVSKDKAGINLGIFFIPNTPPAKQLIKLLWEERHHIEKYNFFLKDQVALQRVLKARPQIQRYISSDVPQWKINSVRNSTIRERKRESDDGVSPLYYFTNSGHHLLHSFTFLIPLQVSR
jgi:hypothetical protein